ncbi:MAG: hypothetical protein ACR2QI_11050, partial [Woeseiaceae bacterium]
MSIDSRNINRTFEREITVMLYEPTTLASFTRVIGETLEKDYGVDPRPLFAEANIDARKFAQPGAR